MQKDDVIYRQAAIDGVKTLHDVAWKNWHEPTLSANVVLDMIRELPSAQPEKRTEERAETHACDLISRQGMCDSLNKYRIEKTLEGKDVSLVWECIDKVLQEPSAQPEQAVKDCRNCKHGKYNDYHDTYFCYNEEDCSNWDKWETSAQPERVWTPCDIPPEHHKDVIVRGIEAIGNVTVYNIMRWDVDRWRPENYAPSITWLDWSEI